MILFFKAHVAGYVRRDGVYVSPHFRRADQYAADAHAGQYRKGKPGAAKVPYIEHPRAVARILHEEAGVDDLVTLQAALLHDTVEDCGVTHQMLVERFGREVADTVLELTNDKSAPSGKLAMQISHAKKMSPRAAAVKVADKTANLRDLVVAPPDWDQGRKRKYFDDARQVVQAMNTRHPVLEKLFDEIYAHGAKL